MGAFYKNWNGLLKCVPFLLEEVMLCHGLKTLPTKGNCKVLASISLATFAIKPVAKLNLPYPMLFINIHKHTK